MMITRRQATLALLALGLTLLVGPLEAKRASKCPVERDQEMDVCASKMGFLGNHNFRVPRNVSEASHFCDQLRASLGCIQSYGRDCLQGFTRQVLNSLMKRGREQYASVCADDRAKASLMARLGCLAGDRIGSLHRCMDASVARFEYIAAEVHPDSRLQSLCCSYQLFNRQLDATLDGICAPAQSRQANTKEFVHKVVGGTAGEFLQLICEGHRSLDDCRASKSTAEVLPRLEEISARAMAGKVSNKNKSLVPVLLEILGSS